MNITPELPPICDEIDHEIDHEIDPKDLQYHPHDDPHYDPNEDPDFDMKMNNDNSNNSRTKPPPLLLVAPSNFKLFFWNHLRRVLGIHINGCGIGQFRGSMPPMILQGKFVEEEFFANNKKYYGGKTKDCQLRLKRMKQSHNISSASGGNVPTAYIWLKCNDKKFLWKTKGKNKKKKGNIQIIFDSFRFFWCYRRKNCRFGWTYAKRNVIRAATDKR